MLARTGPVRRWTRQLQWLLHSLALVALVAFLLCASTSDKATAPAIMHAPCCRTCCHARAGLDALVAAAALAGAAAAAACVRWRCSGGPIWQLIGLLIIVIFPQT